MSVEMQQRESLSNVNTQEKLQNLINAVNILIYFIESLTIADMFCDWQPVLSVVILKKSLEKLLGSDVQLFCQPDELWQKKRTNRETGRTLLEDNPVWYAEDQKSWFANFCIAFKRPWNDTMDCKQQTDRQRPRAVNGCDCWGECVECRWGSCMTQPAWETYGRTTVKKLEQM